MAEAGGRGRRYRRYHMMNVISDSEYLHRKQKVDFDSEFSLKYDVAIIKSFIHNAAIGGYNFHYWCFINPSQNVHMKANVHCVKSFMTG